MSSASFVSSDLNVRVRGRIVEHGPPGPIDGIRLELDPDDGLSIRYPQLVSVRIRPEEQTLWSINSGERLLTLATPLLPPEHDSDHHDASAIDDDDDAAVEGGADKKRHPAVVTLHEGFLPASEADHLESSPLYSSTFQVLIDGPTFPPPHFDPASLAPPTPAVRPHDASSSSSGAGLPGGMLNSPTIQRALLSPLLSPQRRAASQGSDASVPPLSIGLSRTSRASFSAPDRPAVPSSSRGLAALLAPPAPAPAAPTLGGTLTGALSSAAKRTAEELVALRRAHDAYVRRAKAELEILEARVDAFDGKVAGEEEGVVRGFKTRDERDEKLRRSVDAGGGSVSRSRERERGRERGRTPVAEVVEGTPGRSSASGSRDRERPLSQGRAAGGGSLERRGSSASAAPANGSSSSTKATNKDEDMSSFLRAQDEREEDERGRSRSRARRDDAGRRPSSSSSAVSLQGQSSAGQRSRSRTKALAEATARALEGASSSTSSAGAAASAQGRQGDSTSRERAGDAPAGEGDSRGRGRGPRKGENIPATLEEEEEDEEDDNVRDGRGRRGRDGNTTTPRGDPRGGGSSSNGLLSPSSAGAGQPTSRGGAGGSTGTTPTFHPAGHPLVAIPESEELSVTPSDQGDEVERGAGQERQQQLQQEHRQRQKIAEAEEEDDQPFEMDEDVDVDDFDLGSPEPRSAPLESPSLEVGNGPQNNQQHAATVSSSFRPGSFQRASALSASYNALLATASPKMRASPHSPAVGLPVSPSVSAVRAHGSPATRASPGPTAARQDDSALPSFSPPEAHRQTATSAREDAQAALASATFEHARLGDGSGRGGPSGPDPRDVRRGEQKIRDVLAMDVPSHRPLHSTRRRASVGTPSAAAYQADDDETDSAQTSEEDDSVPDLGGTNSAAGLAMSGMASPGGAGAGPRAGGGGPHHQVGSLPIALGRPSSVNAALSSWRPDPEREWAQARERKTSLAQGREQPFVPPIKGQSSARGGGVPTAGGGAAVLPVEPRSAALEIGSPSTPRPTRKGAGGTGISGIHGAGASSDQKHGQDLGAGASASSAMSSILAQSLRNGPASFGRRVEAEGRNGARVDKDALSSGTARAEGVGVADEENNRDEGEEEDEEDEDGFVPPHLVAERRERKDERWLSRSIGTKR